MATRRTNFKDHIHRVRHLCGHPLVWKEGDHSLPCILPTRSCNFIRDKFLFRNTTSLHIVMAGPLSVECVCIWGRGENLGSHKALISCPGLDEPTRPDMKAVTQPPRLLCYLYSAAGGFIPAHHPSGDESG